MKLLLEISDQDLGSGDPERGSRGFAAVMDIFGGGY